MPVAEATWCCVGPPGAGASAGELCEPLSGRRASRDHSDPSRRRGLLLLGVSGVCECVCVHVSARCCTPCCTLGCATHSRATSPSALPLPQLISAPTSRQLRHPAPKPENERTRPE